METAVVEFGRRLAEGGVGFFYYAGHGLQVRGRKYLVPVDAEIESEATTRIAAVDVDLLLEQMAEAKNRVNIVILDACRNNPFERKLRGASRGLAAVDAARGTLVAYATAPGIGGGRQRIERSVTEELLQALRVPGLKVEEVFKRVRVGVTSRSNGGQTPWESSLRAGDLVVNVTVNVTTAAVAAPHQPLIARPCSGRRSRTGPIPPGSRPISSSAPTGSLPRSPASGSPAWPPSRPRWIRRASTAPGMSPSTARRTTHRRLRAATSGRGEGGVLQAQFGVTGQPGSLTLAGRIASDGSGSIAARGVTGDPKFNVNRLYRACPIRTTPTFASTAREEADSASSSVPVRLTFVK